MTALSVLNPLAPHRESVRKLATFGAIGVASTLAYVALYAAIRGVATAGIANAIALVTTALANTAANRRITFAVQGRDGLARDHAAGLVALAAALAITSVSLAALTAVYPRHGRLTEIAVLAVANAAATLVRFLLLRFALTRRDLGRAGDSRTSSAAELATLSQSKRTRG